MASIITEWIARLTDDVSSPIKGITSAAEAASSAVDGISESANGANKEIQKLSAMDLKATADAIRDLTGQFEELMKPGLAFEVQMKEMQAVTRLTDQEMQKLGDSARETAEAFGIDAASQLESYSALVARLGPAIANDNVAMSQMGDNIATLSKLMQGDAVGAMDAMTTAMLQFGVDLSNPQHAAQEMSRMMNVMAAAGNEGASEVIDTAEALKNAGIAAKNSNVSFEETNSALQALAEGGRVGSEAGVSLRNVLGKMGGLDIIPKRAQEKLKALGVNYDIVSDKTLPFTERLRELKKAQGDATLIAQIFGIENEAAANILIESADRQDEMTTAITGTNAAMESADIIMESKAEKMARMNAWLTDLKISFFEVAGGILPFVVGLGTVAFTIANIAAAGAGIAQLVGFVKSLSIVTRIQVGAQWALNIAMTANPIGLIIVAIAALIAIITLAIVYYDDFGAALLLLMGPIGLVVNAIMAIKRNWDSVVSAFKSDGIIAGFKRIGTVLLDVILYPIQQLLELVSNIPGLGDLAGKGAGAIAEIRHNLNLVTPEKALKEKTATEPTLAYNPLQSFQNGGGKVVIPKKTKSGKSKEDADGVKLSGSGSGGGKTINMTVNYYVSGFKGTKEMVNELTGAINNRLSDGLAAL